MFALHKKEHVAAAPSIDRAHAPDAASLSALLYRRRRLIAVTGATFVVVTALLLPMLPVRYATTTQILVEPTNLQVVDKSIVDASQLGDTALLQVESQAELLVSRSVLGRVVAQQNLIADDEFNGTRHGAWSHAVAGLFTAFASETKGGNATNLSDITIDHLRRHIKVNRHPQTFVVGVTVESKDPDKAAALANAVAKAYLDERADAQATTARKAFLSLSGRLDALQQSVRSAEEKVEQFKRVHQIVQSSGRPVTDAEIAEFNEQRVLASTQTAAAKARYDETEQAVKQSLDDSAFPTAIQSPALTLLRQQYAEAARHEADLATTLGPRHPDLMRAQGDVARTRKLIDDEIKRLRLASRKDYQEAAANEANLSNNFDALKTKFFKLGDEEVQLRELERDAVAKRNVYDALAIRLREIGAQESIDNSNVRIISVAEVPRKPSFPPPMPMVLSAALALGLSSGAGIAVMAAQRAAKSSKPT